MGVAYGDPLRRRGFEVDGPCPPARHHHQLERRQAPDKTCRQRKSLAHQAKNVKLGQGGSRRGFIGKGSVEHRHLDIASQRGPVGSCNATAW